MGAGGGGAAARRRDRCSGRHLTSAPPFDQWPFRPGPKPAPSPHPPRLRGMCVSRCVCVPSVPNTRRHARSPPAWGHPPVAATRKGLGTDPERTRKGPGKDPERTRKGPGKDRRAGQKAVHWSKPGKDSERTRRGLGTAPQRASSRRRAAPPATCRRGACWSKRRRLLVKLAAPSGKKSANHTAYPKYIHQIHHTPNIFNKYVSHTPKIFNMQIS